MKILCSISTKNRYGILPLAIQSVLMQTRKPDHLTIYDDNDEPKDLRKIQIYLSLFQTLDEYGVKWDVVYGQKKGQQYNHQHANKQDFDAVWRLDDDCVAEPNVLEELEKELLEGIGAVGGSVLTPPLWETEDSSSNITELHKQNKQWFKIQEKEEVDHLNCTFLYRPNIADYDLRLSKVAHREETMFTYELKSKGYKILIIPNCITWHFKSTVGGIRSTNNAEDYQHDEDIFQKWLEFKNLSKTLIALDSGIGDHIVFKKLLPEVKKKYKNLLLAVCFPDLFKNEGIELISIAQSKQYEDIDKYNVYKWMIDNKWKDELLEAYRKMYL